MKTVKVWDFSVRLFHWTLAALVGAAFLTGDDETIGWHVRGGALIAGLLVYRLVWGLIGPEQARFRHFVRGPRAVFGYLRAYLRGRPPMHLSHNPLGAVMVVTLLFVLFATVVTGALAYSSAEWEGPLSALIGERLGHGLEEAHEALAGSLLFLIPAHVIGVIVSSFLEKQNLVLGMITGKKKQTERGSLASNARLSRFLLAAIAGILVATGIWKVLLPGSARADVPSAKTMIGSLEAEARAKDSSFEGFSPSRGQALFQAEHSVDGEQLSCMSCHGKDPTQPGRTPSGKRLAPFSPVANARAFSNPSKANKKFDRYCEEVLGRRCTTIEKGDLLTWLVSL